MNEETLFRFKDHETEDEWLKARANGVGASESASMCNANPYDTQIQLWEVKTGLRQGFKGNEATERGKRLEPVVRDRFMHKYGWAFDIDYHPYGMYYRADYPMLYATLDGILIAKSNVTIDFGNGNVVMYRKGERIILEIKNPAPRDRAIYDSWNSIPKEYEYQKAQQMFCTGIHHHLLLANITGEYQQGEVDERIFISTDKETEAIVNELKVTAPKFLECVKKKERPAVAMELPAAIPAQAPSIVILDTKIKVGTLVNNYADVKASVEAFASQYKGLIVNEQNLDKAKEISALLNRKAKEFNDQRIGIDKQWNEPMVQFKALVDGLIKTINDTNEPIKKAIKELADDGKAKKEQLCKELIERTIRADYPTLEKIMNSTGGLAVDPKWLNKTTNWNTIKWEIKERMDAIQSRWNMLHAFKETVDSHTWSAMLAEYLKSKRNVESALAVKDSLQKAKELEEQKTAPTAPVEPPQAQETAPQTEIVYKKVVEFSHTDKDEMVNLIRYLKEHGFKCREVK